MRGTTAKSFDWLLHRIYFAGIKMEDKKFVMTLFLSLKVWQKVVKTSPAYNINCLIYCILPSLEFHCNVTNKLVFFLYILFDFFQTGTGMSLVTRPVIPPGSTRMEAFRFPRQFWYSKCLWNPSSDNICRVFPLLLKNNKKVRLRCEKLPIVDLIIGRPFAVAPFPMVPIFDVLQQKKIFGHTWRFQGCVGGLNQKRHFDVFRDKLCNGRRPLIRVVHNSQRRAWNPFKHLRWSVK